MTGGGALVDIKYLFQVEIKLETFISTLKYLFGFSSVKMQNKRSKSKVFNTDFVFLIVKTALS